MSLRGLYGFHASAVLTPVGAVAFLGASGKGKSTLAASLLERNCRLLGDDCLMVRSGDAGYEAIPTYPAVRLKQDSSFSVSHGELQTTTLGFQGKRQHRFRKHDPVYFDAPAPIAAIYVLSEACEAPASELAVRIRRLSTVRLSWNWFGPTTCSRSIARVRFLVSSLSSVGLLDR